MVDSNSKRTVRQKPLACNKGHIEHQKWTDEKLTDRTTGASDAPQDVAASVLRRYRFMEIGNVHGRMETYMTGLEQQWLQMPFFCP